jgi:hypothetical protein
MHTRSRPEKIGILTALVLFLMFPVWSDLPWAAATGGERASFQQSIIDKRYALNRNYKKVVRKKTEYIIVHTSEAGQSASEEAVAGLAEATHIM